MDITDREQIGLALQECEAKFRIALERTIFGVALTDLQGRIMETNDAYQKMVGYTSEELRRRLFTEFTYPEDAPADLNFYGELAAGRRDHYEMEKKYIQKGGRLRRSHLIVSLVRNANGNPQFAIRMEKDMTESKESGSE